mmetsp:Transcript_36746/g.59369  ORF Transcript_36746/g.59369 Transcript_36746/m.59369 type:complete len:205 (+) Transcript_36746:63-677(+)|eukprot:CAMPEP_0184334334 /NCGR_PEP_ID=MMETSP1089-20130417/3163_1 /TAXON_ID=38269 ORGANISM="Gloeochaete wittrockiana, Strain SAG46.84" /NCGR_SAMPLE_ID=MMETSP1089 /ASSEMBLY_ACC=CAM_ASM_000445 /LENGTH=204 /DNA_ID=CAMNT_0026658567 /DNA_START=70 /DNA_END=684 /DNA_ORIENTATION=+
MKPEIVIPPWRVVTDDDLLGVKAEKSEEDEDFEKTTSENEISEIKEDDSDVSEEDICDDRFTQRHQVMERMERKTRVPLRTRKKWVREQLIVADFPYEYAVRCIEELIPPSNGKASGSSTGHEASTSVPVASKSRVVSANRNEIQRIAYILHEGKPTTLPDFLANVQYGRTPNMEQRSEEAPTKASSSQLASSSSRKKGKRAHA